MGDEADDDTTLYYPLSPDRHHTRSYLNCIYTRPHGCACVWFLGRLYIKLYTLVDEGLYERGTNSTGLKTEKKYRLESVRC